jgi:hypothetical protein
VCTRVYERILYSLYLLTGRSQAGKFSKIFARCRAQANFDSNFGKSLLPQPVKYKTFKIRADAGRLSTLLASTQCIRALPGFPIKPYCLTCYGFTCYTRLDERTPDLPFPVRRTAESLSARDRNTTLDSPISIRCYPLRSARTGSSSQHTPRRFQQNGTGSAAHPPSLSSMQTNRLPEPQAAY